MTDMEKLAELYKQIAVAKKTEKEARRQLLDAQTHDMACRNASAKLGNEAYELSEKIISEMG